MIDEAVTGLPDGGEELQLLRVQQEVSVRAETVGILRRADLVRPDFPAVLGHDGMTAADGKVFQSTVVDGLHQRQDSSVAIVELHKRHHRLHAFGFDMDTM